MKLASSINRPLERRDGSDVIGGFLRALSLRRAGACCRGLGAARRSLGPIGHRVSADIAARNINGRARAEVAAILGSETIADALTVRDPAAPMEERYPKTGGEIGEGTMESPVELSWQYDYDWTLAMELRLRQSGYRLAAYLG